MNRNGFLAVLSISSALLLSACAPNLGGSNYTVAAVGEMSETFQGKVLSVRIINIDASQGSRSAGALAGGIAGAAAGNAMGGGRGRTLATAGVGLLGAFAGNAIAGEAGKQQGFEYVVKLKDGRIITVTQGAEPVLNQGQKVLVIKSNRNRSRVIPDNS